MKTSESTILPLAISIKQPWASLIIHRGKDVENRTWKTNYRGPVLIHASLKKDLAELNSFLRFRTKWGVFAAMVENPPMTWGDLPSGGIIGTADIVDCVRESKSSWFVGPFGWVLANARPVPFFPCVGHLGLWRCPYPTPPK